MSKRFKILAISLFIAVMMVMSFSAGCIYFGVRNSTPGVSNGSSTAVAATGMNTGLLEDAWDIIYANYVEPGKLDGTTLNEGAVRGMVDAINDPYTSYLTPQQYENETSSLEGSFEGIGAVVSVKDNQIILTPIAGSPAERAGIKAGDIVLEVDGQSTVGMSTTTLVSIVRGPKGTTVTLTVLHEGETTPVEIDIVREEIKLPSVSLEMKDDVAYIRLSQFTERSGEELTEVIKQLTQQGATGIVLDLRDNPGGVLLTCVEVAGHFIREGDIITSIDNAGNRDTYSVKGKNITITNRMGLSQSYPLRDTDSITDLPMVVLVNEYSASASEVLSGALQDYERATIAGKITFGKGSVGQIFELDDGSGILLTIGRWFTPEGRLIEGQGITPDIELTQEGDDAIQWAIDYLHGDIQE